MAGTYLGYVFDEEIFNYTWQQEPDPKLTAMVESGAIVKDKGIEELIGARGNRFTIPFYNTLDESEEAANFDGNTDVPVSAHTSDYQSGVVYGRLKGWKSEDFNAIITGDDPMNDIARQVAKWWNKKHQKILLGILGAIFSSTPPAKWQEAWGKHIYDIKTTGSSVTDANKLGLSTINDAMTIANGDNKDIYSLAIMHSAVANRAENLQMLDFWVHTDASGIQRKMQLANINGLTAVIDDGVPVKQSATATGEMEYTTYLLGEGFIRMADGNLKPPSAPSAIMRDEITDGGIETLVTRVRRTYHPNGFSFKLDISDLGSPTDVQLFNPSNWILKFNPKAIPAAQVITNG